MNTLSAPTSLPRRQVANANFVTPNLLVGGDLSFEDGLATAQLDELVTAGVTHIVDARIEWSDEIRFAEQAPEVVYFHHGMDDAGQDVPFEWWDQGVAFATGAIAAGGVVLTHCHMGINRGPSLGFATLLAQGWDPVEALASIRGARPIAAIAYAEQALRWHHARTGASPDRRQAEIDGVDHWREDNWIDVPRIIREVRKVEWTSGNAERP